MASLYTVLFVQGKSQAQASTAALWQEQLL
jgi:hypothetical protein